jgi:hypothetical protein
MHKWHDDRGIEAIRGQSPRENGRRDVIFVLPNKTRLGPGANLLSSAKFTNGLHAQRDLETLGHCREAALVRCGLFIFRR